jgi:putative RecB family exonuclease
VHAALERLFCLDAPARTLPAALDCLTAAAADLREHPEFAGLELDAEAEATFVAEARALLERYFRLEDPTAITPIGIELKLEIELGGVRLRGIIDRLELDADGELVVTDYKTGRAPGERQEQQRLAGVAFYSLLCERLFGRRPARVQLLYLADPVAIIATPTDRSTRGVERKLAAVWTAVERACEREDFRPNPSRLCDWCGFKAYCPSFGGDIALADAHRQQLELV